MSGLLADVARHFSQLFPVTSTARLRHIPETKGMRLLPSQTQEQGVSVLWFQQGSV
jgi:hypothetical protein